MQSKPGNCASLVQLISELDRSCVAQRISRDAQELDAWQADEAARCSAGTDVRLLDEVHHLRVHEALSEWEAHSEKMFKRFGGSRTAFAFWFQHIRDDVRSHRLRVSDARRDPLISGLSEQARRVVSNIGWCTAFGYYLPRAAPSLAWRCVGAGLEMLAIYWLEDLARAQDRARIDSFPQHATYENTKIDQLIDGCIAAVRRHQVDVEED